MEIRLYSDLHLEFERFSPGHEAADVVILAGDIHVGVKGVEWAIQQSFCCPVIYILGNHEFYGHRYPGLIEKARAAATGTQIHVLENETLDIDGIRFHGATLWTNFELFGDAPMAGFQCQHVINDFRKIRRQPSYSKLRAMDAAAIHRRSIAWLGRSLEASSSSRNIVVTHHAPSLRSVDEHYRHDIVSAAFASNLEEFILKHKPDYWLHGHLHSNSDYEIGGCRVVCNARGYKDGENEEFYAAGAIVEV